MMTRRSLILALTSGLIALSVMVLPVLAEELLGTIKSVNADGNMFVVTSDDKDVTVTVNDTTTYENAKGKTVKNALKRMNPGGQVEVTHEKGVASKVVLKKGAVKKKDAN
jgi:hypothetical protein